LRRRHQLRIGIRLVGRTSKRGVRRQSPTPAALIDDLEAWLRKDAEEMVVSARRLPTTADRAVLLARLHPAAREIEITATAGGRISAGGSTAEVGPGYHTYLARLLRRLGAENGISWEAADPIAGTGDLTGHFESGNREDAERSLLAWLRAQLQAASERRASGGEPYELLAAEAEHFDVIGAVATALGPRDDAWLRAAVENPRVAIEAWPWFADATDARYLLNRAVCHMWTDVRWRPPTEAGENELIVEVLRLLRRAFPLDPGLPYPWREWKELLDFAGQPDQMRERVEAEAAAASPTSALIGYRRRQVRVEQAGWTITIPGSFATRRTEEEFWAGGGGRTITIAATPTGTGDAPMPPDVFLDSVTAHLGGELLRHDANGVAGRAKLALDPTSAVEAAVLEGYSAVRGSGAAVRIVIHSAEDWDWALGMWRSLRPVAPALRAA
jgi:hypothetical protein